MWPKTLRFPLRLAWQRWQGLGLCYHDNVCPYIITAVTQSDLAHCPASTPPLHTPLYVSLPFTICWADPYIPRWLTKTQGPRRVVEPWDWSGGSACPPTQMDYIRFFWEDKGEKSHHLITWFFLGVPDRPYFQMVEPTEIWCRACFHMLCDSWEIFLPV